MAEPIIPTADDQAPTPGTPVQLTIFDALDEETADETHR